MSMFSLQYYLYTKNSNSGKYARITLFLDPILAITISQNNPLNLNY